MIPQERRPGFALLAALGIMLVTAAAALSISTQARIKVTRVDAHVQAVQNEAIVHVVALAVIDSLSDLLARPAFRTFSQLGVIDTVDDAVVTSSASDLAAKVNINVTSADGLRRFLVASGIGERAADIAGQSIVDWRDPDDLHHPRGAEAGWYKAIGMDVMPPNRDIARIDELRSVRGVDVDVFAVLAAGATAFGEGTVNVNSAPLEVLVSLPAISHRAARAIMSRRDARPFDSLLDFAQAVPQPEREAVEQRAAEIAERLAFTMQEAEIRIAVRSSRAAAGAYCVVKHMGDGRLTVVNWQSRS